MANEPFIGEALKTGLSVLYRQSDVPEIFELSWILACFTPKGFMNRAHAYKASVDKNVEQGEDPDAGITMGLFSYPVLMAADILMFNAHEVPVGKDQAAHLELSREIVRAFNNRYWPAHYFIDAQGRVRYHHFGEGRYELSERVIRQLLAEAGRAPSGTAGPVSTEGVEAQAARETLRSPETYLGFARAANFVSPGGMVRDRRATYLPGRMALNQWSLAGDWTVRREHAEAERAGARIAFRFHARDLHLVMASASGRPVRFRVTIDGRAPRAAAGVDVDAAGNGVVREERLYQLVRQPGEIGERLFEIEFLDPGVQAFAFTFG